MFHLNKSLDQEEKCHGINNNLLKQIKKEETGGVEGDW